MIHFQQWWLIYPNNGRRVNKVKCLALWNKNGCELLGFEIIEHTRAMKTTKSWLDGYEPLAATYLHQKRYADGLPAECKKSVVRDTFNPESFVPVDHETRTRVAEKLKTLGAKRRIYGDAPLFAEVE